eukprot:PITA_25121
MGWEIHQMDVKTTFLNGVIEEEVYVEHLEGFETHEKKSHVCRLKKALCGLKWAPRAWIIQDHWGLQEESSHKIRYEGFGTNALLLGLEVWQEKLEIFLGQRRYATKILKRLRMEDCRPMSTPMITNWKKIDASKDKDVDPTLYRQLIGSLMYLVNTRLDICYTVNTLSQFMVEAKRAHWAVAKHVLMYLQGIIDYGPLYTKCKDISLSGFTDADWAGSSVDWKSTSRYCFNIGSGMTSWCNRKHKSVALSSSEAEYMAARTTSCEAIWLRKLLVNLFRRNMEVIRIVCDNQSCNKLSENLVFHDMSKHIDIWCHFVKDYVQRGAVQSSYAATGEQVANILTKALGRTKFDYIREKMGMVKNPFQ